MNPPQPPHTRGAEPFDSQYAQSKRSRNYVSTLCKPHFLPMFNLFPHNISNVFEAVSSLVLGAGPRPHPMQPLLLASS